MPYRRLVKYDIFTGELGYVRWVGTVSVPALYLAYVRLEADYTFTKHSTTGEVTHSIKSFPTLILPHVHKRSDALAQLKRLIQYDIYVVEDGRMKKQGMIALPKKYFAHVKFEATAISFKPGSQETEQILISIPTILMPYDDTLP